jgi:hypothetical protein
LADFGLRIAFTPGGAGVRICLTPRGCVLALWGTTGNSDWQRQQSGDEGDEHQSHNNQSSKYPNIRKSLKPKGTVLAGFRPESLYYVSIKSTDDLIPHQI